VPRAWRIQLINDRELNAQSVSAGLGDDRERQRMKTIHNLAAAATAALAFSPTPLAHADFSSREQQFLRDVAAVGLANGANPDRLVADGYVVCNYLRQGVPPRAVAQTIWQNSAHANGVAGMTFDQTLYVVASANADLCPAVAG
jgi:hypothetical protein